MRKKWKNARGETLVEVLAAILIGTLAIALLFGATTVSANLNVIAKETDDEFYEYLKAAEEQTTPITDASIVPADAKITVQGKNSAGIDTSNEIDVNFYGGPGIYSYKLK